MSPLSASRDASPHPLALPSVVEAQVAQAAVIKVLKVQAEMSKDVLRLLDPSAGTRLNRSA